MESSSVAKRLTFSGCASIVAAGFTHPIDTIKVKIQLIGNLKSNGNKNIIKTIISEGGLFLGIEAALLRSATYGSIRYSIYNPIKQQIDGSQHNSSTISKIISGSISGCLASAICNPTDLIKVRMQSSTSHYNYNYTGILDACRKIFASEGIRGFWTGVGPTCIRATVLAAAELTAYDEAKEFLVHNDILTDGVPLYLVSSAISSFVASAATNPFDFAKSRIMANVGTGAGAGASAGAGAGGALGLAVAVSTCTRAGDVYGGYSRAGGVGVNMDVSMSTFECMRSSVQREGFLVLWSGFGATFARLCPNIVITFVVMESLKNRFDK